MCDHDELKRLAEAAYSSGPWEAHSIEHPYEATKGPSGYEFPAGSYSEWQIRTAWVHGQAKGKVSVVGLASGRDGASVWLHKDDAAFIAAFNPTTCSALLSEIAALRGDVAALDEMRGTVRVITGRLNQAERQRDEAVGLLRELADGRSQKNNINEYDDLSVRASTLIANQGADR